MSDFITSKNLTTVKPKDINNVVLSSVQTELLSTSASSNSEAEQISTQTHNTTVSKPKRKSPLKSFFEKISSNSNSSNKNNSMSGSSIPVTVNSETILNSTGNSTKSAQTQSQTGVPGRPGIQTTTLLNDSNYQNDPSMTIGNGGTTEPTVFRMHSETSTNGDLNNTTNSISIQKNPSDPFDLNSYSRSASLKIQDLNQELDDLLGISSQKTQNLKSQSQVQNNQFKDSDTLLQQQSNNSQIGSTGIHTLSMSSPNDSTGGSTTQTPTVQSITVQSTVQTGPNTQISRKPSLKEKLLGAVRNGVSSRSSKEKSENGNTNISMNNINSKIDSFSFSPPCPQSQSNPSLGGQGGPGPPIASQSNLATTRPRTTVRNLIDFEAVHEETRKYVSTVTENSNNVEQQYQGQSFNNNLQEISDGKLNNATTPGQQNLPGQIPTSSTTNATASQSQNLNQNQTQQQQSQQGQYEQTQDTQISELQDEIGILRFELDMRDKEKDIEVDLIRSECNEKVEKMKREMEQEMEIMRQKLKESREKEMILVNRELENEVQQQTKLQLLQINQQLQQQSQCQEINMRLENANANGKNTNSTIQNLSASKNHIKSNIESPPVSRQSSSASKLDSLSDTGNTNNNNNNYFDEKDHLNSEAMKMKAFLEKLQTEIAMKSPDLGLMVGNRKNVKEQDNVISPLQSMKDLDMVVLEENSSGNSYTGIDNILNRVSSIQNQNSDDTTSNAAENLTELSDLSSFFQKLQQTCHSLALKLDSSESQLRSEKQTHITMVENLSKRLQELGMENRELKNSIAVLQQSQSSQQLSNQGSTSTQTHGVFDRIRHDFNNIASNVTVSGVSGLSPPTVSKVSTSISKSSIGPESQSTFDSILDRASAGTGIDVSSLNYVKSNHTVTTGTSSSGRLQSQQSSHVNHINDKNNSTVTSSHVNVPRMPLSASSILETTTHQTKHPSSSSHPSSSTTNTTRSRTTAFTKTQVPGGPSATGSINTPTQTVVSDILATDQNWFESNSTTNSRQVQDNLNLNHRDRDNHNQFHTNREREQRERLHLRDPYPTTTLSPPPSAAALVAQAHAQRSKKSLTNLTTISSISDYSSNLNSDSSINRHHHGGIPGSLASSSSNSLGGGHPGHTDYLSEARRREKDRTALSGMFSGISKLFR